VKVEMEGIPAPAVSSFPIKSLSAFIRQKATRRVSGGSGKEALFNFTLSAQSAGVTLNGKPSRVDFLDKDVMVALRMSPGGEIAGPDGGGGLSTEEKTARESVRAILVFPLPRGRVKPGSTWEDSSGQALFYSSHEIALRGKTTYRFEKIEKWNGRDCMLVGFEGNMEMQPAGREPLPVKGTAKVQGSFLFDWGRGEVVKARKEIDLKMEMGFGGPLGEALKLGGLKVSPRAVITLEAERSVAGR
jgi:hypothetical protein